MITIKSMKIFTYEIRAVQDNEAEIKRQVLDGAENNALRGLVQAKLELTHHKLLLEQAPELNRTEQEIKGYEEAIERDKKSINNWENQLRAIKHERKNN